MNRKIIVNADDFGQVPNINEAVIRGHEEGIITSASVIITSNFSEEALRIAKDYPELSLGLHFNFSSDKPVSSSHTTFADNGRFPDADRMTKEGKTKEFFKRALEMRSDEIYYEMEAQIELFRGWYGEVPCHCDIHWFLGSLENFTAPYVAIAKRYQMFIRPPVVFGSLDTEEWNPNLWRIDQKFVDQLKFKGLETTDFINFRFSGRENSNVESLEKILADLEEGVTEIVCHPGLKQENPTAWGNLDWYGEFKTLTSPGIKEFIREQKIKLTSHKELKRQK